MAPGAADRGPYAAPLLLRDLDRVDAPAPDPLGEPAELADRMADADEKIRSLVDEELCTDVASRFLAARQDQDYVSRRRGFLLSGPEDSAHEHRDPTLHVERAAAPDDAIHELAAKRRVEPLLGRRRNDVDVPIKEE